MKDATPRAIQRTDYTPPAFLVDTVDLEVTLAPSDTRVVAHTRFQRNPAAERDDDLVLDGQNMRLLSIALDGKALDESSYALSDDGLTIKGVPDAFTLEVTSGLAPKANKSLEGLYLSSGNYCTQCEAEGFRKITWFLDRPDVMARYRTRIVADKETCPVLLSNGNLVETGELPGGKHFAVWDDPHKKPSYLFALVAGRLVRREDAFTTRSGREVTLHVYVEEGNLDKTEHCMESVKRAMKWDEDVYGREYDLDIFQIVAVSDFNMGAMENKGLNIFNTKYVLARPDTATDADFMGVEGVVGHEYFHNWSGNRVTCRDWFQLSLKEGFTVFRDQEFSADMGSRAVKRIEDVLRLRAAQFPEDAGPMAHPVRPDSYVEINNFYTPTVYEKGAEVVRMMHTLLGAEAFRKGTDLYFERHDGCAVTCDDFVAALEDASGKDLTHFRRWYAQAGTPRVTARSSWDETSRRLTLTLSQRTDPTPGQPEKQPLHIPVAMGLLDDAGNDLPLRLAGEQEAIGTTRVLELVEAEQTFVFEDVPVRPVLSLFRGFSAPVLLETDSTDDDRVLRMAKDSDSFNRWEASQELARKVLLGLVRDVQAGRPLVANEKFLGAFATALGDEEVDPALLAYALALPSEGVLAEAMDVVDPDAIHAARDFLKQEIARALGDRLRARYVSLVDEGPFRLDAEAIGRRALKNLCLSYLVAGGDEALAAEQLGKATNMTDAIAALGLLASTDGAARDEALASFYARWKGEALVVDKWFMVQATSSRKSALEEVKALASHPAFDITNPNKVRALIGAFAAQNPVRFHAEDGAGYAFLADQVLEIDAFNPQIAARLVAPLGRWRRFDEGRAAKMKAQLRRLLEREGVSPDVYEVASKSLAD